MPNRFLLLWSWVGSDDRAPSRQDHCTRAGADELWRQWLV